MSIVKLDADAVFEGFSCSSGDDGEAEMGSPFESQSDTMSFEQH